MTTEDASKDQLLNEIHRLHDELEKVPSYQEMNDHGEYSVYTYSRVFGSWNEAVESAGYSSHSNPAPTSKEELLAELERVAEKCNRKPTRRDLEEHGSVCATTYSNKFGSWNAALKAAGFTPRTMGQRISRDELRSELEALAEELDAPPTTTDMNKKGSYSASTYIRRFGSWNEALNLLEISPE